MVQAAKDEERPLTGLLQPCGLLQPTPCGAQLPPWGTPVCGLRAPLILADQPLNVFEHSFGQRARIHASFVRHRHVNEDAVNVLLVAEAVHIVADIPDPVLLLLGVVVRFYAEDNVGEVRPSGLHNAENDVSYFKLRLRLRKACIPSAAVTALTGWKVHAPPDWTKGHIELPEDA